MDENKFAIAAISSFAGISGTQFLQCNFFALFLSCAVLDISQGDTPKMNQAKRWIFANVYLSLRKT